MDKVRILGIAPYEGMKALMQKLAAEDPGIDLTVFVGDLQEGVEIARSNFHNNYDVIISRGGTAELISRHVATPVVEIPLSPFDLLRALKLAERVGRYAIVGHPNITSNAQVLCGLLDCGVDIFTIHGAEEVEQTLRTVKAEGYETVLCDVVSNHQAKQLGLNAVLILSGEESIREAFAAARRLCGFSAQLREENRFLRSVIAGQVGQTVIFDQRGDLFFSTLSEAGEERVLGLLREELSHARAAGAPRRFQRNLDGMLYSIRSQTVQNSGEDYTAFYFSEARTPLPAGRNGIRFLTCPEAEQEFHSGLYSLSDAGAQFSAALDRLQEGQQPVMITGEEGSGKRDLALALYTRGIWRDRPMVTVDCPYLGEKSWAFLLDHHSSPLNDAGSTLFFQNVEALDQERQRALLSALTDMDLGKRNRLIFSCSCPAGASLTPQALAFTEALSCVVLELPPLRAGLDRLPTLANLYLSELNTSLTHQIVGIDQEALALLKGYDWPRNYSQFQRVIGELAGLAASDRIGADEVRAVLRRERSAVSVSQGHGRAAVLDLERTLGEIERDVAALVLDECGSNQSQCAKRLGISRTTLWRMVKA